MLYEITISCVSDLTTDELNDTIKATIESKISGDVCSITIEPSLGVNKKEIIVTAIISIIANVASNLLTDGIKDFLNNDPSRRILVRHVSCEPTEAEGQPGKRSQDAGRRDRE